MGKNAACPRSQEQTRAKGVADLVDTGTAYSQR